MKTPDRIKGHADDYKDDSWKDYTPEQLAQWVILLGLRAGHRTSAEKKDKDLYDAHNYLAMLESWLDAQD